METSTENSLQQIFSSFSKLGIEQALRGLGILLLGIVLVKLVMRIIDRTINNIRGLDSSLHTMLKSTIRFTLYVLVILSAASSVGIPVTSFVALLSVISLAISLAIQGVLNNLCGGIIILASHPFKLGDFVETDSISGTVQEIGILHTHLLTFEGHTIYVPNNIIYSSKLVNYTANGLRRADLPISASYDNTPDQVREAVMDAINRFPEILKDPAPEVVLDSYGDHAINYIVRVWTAAEHFGIARFQLNEALYHAFKRHQVEMTYPHLNVHMQQN